MSNNDIRALLVAARETISDPARLARFEFAVSAKGRSVKVSSPRAVAWCSLGIIEKVAGDDIQLEAAGRRALHLAARALTGESWASADVISDYSDHATVLKMWDLAIASEEEPDAPNG